MFSFAWAVPVTTVKDIQLLTIQLQRDSLELRRWHHQVVQQQ